MVKDVVKQESSKKKQEGGKLKRKLELPRGKWFRQALSVAYKKGETAAEQKAEARISDVEEKIISLQNELAEYRLNATVGLCLQCSSADGGTQDDGSVAFTKMASLYFKCMRECQSGSGLQTGDALAAAAFLISAMDCPPGDAVQRAFLDVAIRVCCLETNQDIGLVDTAIEDVAKFLLCGIIRKVGGGSASRTAPADLSRLPVSELLSPKRLEQRQAAEGVELGQRVLQRLLDGSITGPPTLLGAATLLEGCLRELLVDGASPIQEPAHLLLSVIQASISRLPEWGLQPASFEAGFNSIMEAYGHGRKLTSSNPLLVEHLNRVAGEVLERLQDMAATHSEDGDATAQSSGPGEEHMACVAAAFLKGISH